MSMAKVRFAAFLVPITLICQVMSAGSPTPSKGETGTGVEGIISISPIHGGPTRQGVPDSKPLPDVEFLVTKDGRSVGSFQTDSQGRFQLSLPPGHYAISRKDQKSGLGSYSKFEVDVVAGQMKQVHWEADSGIR